MVWSGLIRHWGSTADERAAAYPCDTLLEESGEAVFRAVSIDTGTSIAFRWLCQLRAAPYSYDLLDNRGRRSPRELTPGLEQLATGQRVMTIFELVGFEPDRSITLRHSGRVFGELAVTYQLDPIGPGRCRLVVKLVPGPARGALAALGWWLLATGDLVMMRRQLLNLKRLAEASASIHP